IHQNSHGWLVKQVENQRKKGVNSIYDPNLRKGYFDEIELFDLRQSVEKCMSTACLVKASIEDLELIWGEMSNESYYDKVNQFCPYLILTLGDRGASFFSPKYSLDVDGVRCIKLLSTVGAGDNLNAGVVSGIVDLGVQSFSELTKNEWVEVLKRGVKFGSAVCAVKQACLDKTILGEAF
ncbi:PfkB family carbohydrate kinase, partial [Fibrobacterales bacterium]|nr:PfkB family carbohydrate kinase [Fibrobacterales bacterium]